MQVEMSVDYLADFIFKKNINNAAVELSLDGLSNAKDFFFFCLDLFCKGLVCMFGNGNNMVQLQDLKMEDFIKIRDKLVLAGIDARLEVHPPDIDIQPLELQLNMKELREAPDDMPLKDYKFIIKCNEFTYIIKFNVVHNCRRDCNGKPVVASKF